MWSQVPSEASHSRKRVPATTQRLFASRFEARIRIVPVLNCPRIGGYLAAAGLATFALSFEFSFALNCTTDLT
jgi:hypothetical protein